MTNSGIELILLPGLDGTGLLFKRLESCLAWRMPVTAVSYPKDPKSGYRELIALIEARMGTKPIVVLGESFSGPIAVELAARHPNQVKGLILAATFLRSPWPPWIMKAAAHVDIDYVPSALRNRFLRGSRVDPELDADIAIILSQMPAGVRAARLGQVAGADVRQLFETVTCPVLALHGTRDWVVPRFAIKAAIQHKAKARMKEFGAGHMLLQTRAEASADQIAAFVHDIESEI